VTADPGRTVITGSSAGGLASAYVALLHPDIFGNVLSQSGAFWRGNEGSTGAPYEWLTGRYAATPRRPIRFVLDVGELETHTTAGTGPSILDANRRLRDVLRAQGYDVRYTEVPGGVHAPGTWGPRLPGDLADLVAAWPEPPGSASR
jgi:enterochelin esterase family protein